MGLTDFDLDDSRSVGLVDVEIEQKIEAGDFHQAVESEGDGVRGRAVALPESLGVVVTKLADAAT